jgi:catalase (peroxidase I)
MEGSGGQMAECPVAHGARGRRNRDWWPNQLNIEVLHQHSPLSDPMGEDFDYAKEFKSLGSECCHQGPARLDGGFPGLVAG